MSNSIVIEQVPVKLIADPAFNSRSLTDVEADANLATSVKRDGIAVPIKVVKHSDTQYQLVYGSRRLRAARTAGLTTIPAIVAPPPPQGAGDQHKIDQMVENARENLARKDLTPYEQARTFSELRRMGMKLADVSARVGVTAAHVSNLATIYVQADPKIITEWSKGNPAATTGFLRDLVAREKDGAKQVLLFKEREEQLATPAPDEDNSEENEDEADFDESDEPTKDKPVQKFHVDKGRYRMLLRRLKATRSPAIAINAVKYLVGTMTKIPGVIDDKPEE